MPMIGRRMSTSSQAQVEKAKSILIATNRDDTNVLIALTAKELNPKIRVVTQSNELEVFYRGDTAEIATFPGKQLDNKYAGNTVDICPVGALTSKDFRFKIRVWFLQETKSICPGCARGCNINMHHHDGRDLQLEMAGETLRNLAAIWGAPVHLRTKEDGRDRHLICREGEIAVRDEADGGAAQETPLDADG